MEVGCLPDCFILFFCGQAGLPDCFILFFVVRRALLLSTSVAPAPTFIVGDAQPALSEAEGFRVLFFIGQCADSLAKSYTG
jgi:hypothetical protein